jgi:hypothetical protein
VCSHGFVYMNSKGHILFDNFPPEANFSPDTKTLDRSFVARWCIYDPALRKINGNDEIFLSDATGIVKFANGVRTPVPNLTGELRGVTDGDDILTEDVKAKTCYLQGGPLGSQTILNFDCKEFKLVDPLNRSVQGYAASVERINPYALRLKRNRWLEGRGHRLHQR